jgi:hypothetical protein
MAPVKSINITTPCQQLWQQMDLVEAGRYCQSCCKTVIDFSVMTDKAIINYLGSQENVCGRFGDHQLTGLNDQLQRNKPSFAIFKRISLVAAVLMATPFARANAQKRHKTEYAQLRWKWHDTINIVPKQLTVANLKNELPVPSVKNTDLINETQLVSGTLGGVTISGVIDRPAITRVWTSIYDMLRAF